MKAKTDDLLLRRALRGNALFSTVSGLALAAGAFAIGPRIGVEPSWIVLLVGLGLLPFAFDLFTNAARQRVDLARAKTAIAGDVAWVVGSIAVILIDPTGLTTAGVVTIAIVAAVVADFAMLQWLGLRRAAAAYAGDVADSAAVEQTA